MAKQRKPKDTQSSEPEVQSTEEEAKIVESQEVIKDPAPEQAESKEQSSPATDTGQVPEPEKPKGYDASMAVGDKFDESPSNLDIPASQMTAENEAKARHDATSMAVTDSAPEVVAPPVVATSDVSKVDYGDLPDPEEVLKALLIPMLSRGAKQGQIPRFGAAFTSYLASLRPQQTREILNIRKSQSAIVRDQFLARVSEMVAEAGIELDANGFGQSLIDRLAALSKQEKEALAFLGNVEILKNKLKGLGTVAVKLGKTCPILEQNLAENPDFALKNEGHTL